MLGTITNWGRCSEIVAARLPHNEPDNVTFVNMLSISVSEWLVILAGCKKNGKKDFDARESKNSVVGLWTL